MLLTPFLLRIITPTTQKELNVLSIEISSPTGSFLVTHSHVPIISLIRTNGSISFRDTYNKSETLAAPRGGFFQMNGTQATIILDH